MRILGIDPGYAIIGWAIVDVVDSQNRELVDYGVIETHKDDRNSQRLLEIDQDIKEILKAYKPNKAVVETLIFNKNVTTAMLVSEARGVLMVNFEKHSMEIVELTPQQIKQSITGYGKAEKSQVQSAVKLLCDLEEIPKPDDAADAVAAALAG